MKFLCYERLQRKLLSASVSLASLLLRESSSVRPCRCTRTLVNLLSASELNVKQEKDAIPQVIFNKKEFNQELYDFSKLYPGEQEWEAFATVLLSSLHNLQGTMMMQIQTFLASTTFQQPGNSQRKWTLQGTQPTQQTTQCSTVETWESHLVAKRPRVHAEKSMEAVSCCDHAQNLEAAQLLISKRDLNKPKLWWISHRSQERCNSRPGFYFSFVGIADDLSRPAIRAS